MPIALEQLHQPSAEDQRDLAAIYPEQASPQWIEQRLERGELLLAGRFNDRLLGALWARPANGQWQLYNLQVRANTRRRGVATQMLTLLCQRADSRGTGLLLDIDGDSVLDALLTALGFVAGHSQTGASTGTRTWTRAARQ